jgi:hypothetical protein
VQPNPLSRKIINSISGHRVPTLGTTNLFVHITGTGVQHEFIITEQELNLGECRILLGLDFLMKTNAKLDFGERFPVYPLDEWLDDSEGVEQYPLNEWYLRDAPTPSLSEKILLTIEQNWFIPIGILILTMGVGVYRMM